MSDNIPLASSQTNSLLFSPILESTQESPGPFSTFREASNRFLQDPGSEDDFNEGPTKRQRCADDGKYSSCPSPSDLARYSSLPYKELEQPGRTEGGNTRYFGNQTNISKSQGEWMEKQDIDFNTMTMANLNVLDEGDEEACFGMIKGTIISTDPILDLMRKLHAERLGEAQHRPLSLKLVVIQEEIQVAIDTHPTSPAVGRLPASLSVVLLPLLGFSLVRMQALTFPPFEEVIERQGKRQAQAQNIKIFINIYGDSTIRSKIGLFLSKNSVFLQHPKFPEPGHPYRNPHFLSRPGSIIYITKPTLTGGVIPVDNLIRDTKDEVSVHASLSHIFDGLCGSTTQGKLLGDKRYLKSPLYEHQSQGLYFLAMREQAERNSSYPGNYSNRGGILADYMGLGKTLTILSLIVRSLDEARALNTRSGCLLSVPGEMIRSGATLIVAPVSVLGNWEGQIAVHTQPKALRYLVYYGRNKPTNPRALSQYDIVFTSFQTLTQEWKPTRNSSSCGPLYAIDWFRVILDEAHEIRTQTTIKCQAACAISADRRWCITGTPLQNDITDIATLFKFLRLEPLNTKQNFDRHITAKWKAGDASGMKTLRDVLRQICLRRAKETISDRLPTRTVNIKYLDFNNRERILYDSHKDKLSSVVKSACDSTFQVLLRLRLICDHGKDLLPRGDVEIRCSTCDMQLRDWEMDAGQISNIRAVPEDRDTPSPGCGLCARVQENIGTAFPNYQGPSTKVQALIDSIKTCTSEDIMNREPVSKHVVFSSWTRMLDLIGLALVSNGIMFCRLDGSMSRLQRNNTLANFSTNPQVIVILVSLMAGGVGINLTCASKVHVLEPHWNPMIEQQAVERVHRLRQRRDVTITRYIMKDSFEIDMMRYQDRKLELVKQSLDSHTDPDAMEICAAEGNS